MRLANFTLSSIKNEYEKYKEETENYYVYKGEKGKFITLITGVPIVIVLFITAIVLDIFIHIGAKHYMREAEKYAKEFSYYRRQNHLTKVKLSELTEIDLERIIDFEKGYELPSSEEQQRINFILKIPPQSN